MKPKKEKIKAIQLSKRLHHVKKLKLLLGAIQNIADLPPKLLEKEQPIETANEEKNGLQIDRKRGGGLQEMKKKMMAGIPCLAHFAGDQEYIITTDASENILRITLPRKPSGKTI